MRLLSVCGGTDRIVVDLDRREAYVSKFPVRANFFDDGFDQLTAPLGFRVHKGARLERKSDANPVSRNGLPCGRSHVDFLQEIEDGITTLPRQFHWRGVDATDQGPGRRDAWGNGNGVIRNGGNVVDARRSKGTEP